jgi:hypothetical protein
MALFTNKRDALEFVAMHGGIIRYTRDISDTADAYVFPWAVVDYWN